MAGIVVVGGLILVAVLAPLLTSYSPVTQDLEQSLQGPSAAHWLGTDQFGRDVLTRVLWSARVDLRIGFLAVLIPFVAGSVLGALAGYFGGWLDTVVMRLVDIFYAFPFYVMVIALV
ncbi:MAG: ABC transporter permease, partial [Trebonia sp.]